MRLGPPVLPSHHQEVSGPVAGLEVVVVVCPLVLLCLHYCPTTRLHGHTNTATSQPSRQVLSAGLPIPGPGQTSLAPRPAQCQIRQ